MKPFDYSQWNLPSENKGLLFFVQAIEEQLFHYAHDSLKVPALNFHFLCFEIRNTIQKVRLEMISSSYSSIKIKKEI